MPTLTILWVILIDEIMVVTGLVGALVKSSYKFGYFVFGCIALFVIAYSLAIDARGRANKLGKDIGRTFLICGAMTTFLWFLYPIAWGLCEGGNVISPDSEAVFYGVLDLLAKPVFGALLIWGHKDIDPARLGLNLKDYTEEDAQVCLLFRSSQALRFRADTRTRSARRRTTPMAPMAPTVPMIPMVTLPSKVARPSQRAARALRNQSSRMGKLPPHHGRESSPR